MTSIKAFGLGPVLPSSTRDASFRIIADRTRGTFEVEPVSVTPVGDELVVTQVRNSLSFESRSVVLDVVAVWRIVGGKVLEVWGIVPGQPTEVQNEGR